MSELSPVIKKITLPLLAIIVVMVFLYVWPGPLRYVYKWKPVPTRIDRLSHHVYTLTDSGWKLDLRSMPRKRLPLQESSDVIVTCTSKPGTGDVSFDIHNGSGWTITEFTMMLRTGEYGSRYRVVLKQPLKSLTAGKASITIDEAFAVKWKRYQNDSRWQIESAKGFRDL